MGSGRKVGVLPAGGLLSVLPGESETWGDPVGWAVLSL